MKGFAFTIDMVLGILVVVLLASILVRTATPTEAGPNVWLQIKAKDAAMSWFYGAPASTPTNPLNKPFACDVAYRPLVTTTPLDPAQPSSWSSQSNCVVGS